MALGRFVKLTSDRRRIKVRLVTIRVPGRFFANRCNPFLVACGRTSARFPSFLVIAVNYIKLCRPIGIRDQIRFLWRGTFSGDPT